MPLRSWVREPAMSVKIWGGCAYAEPGPTPANASLSAQALGLMPQYGLYESHMPYMSVYSPFLIFNLRSHHSCHELGPWKTVSAKRRKAVSAQPLTPQPRHVSKAVCELWLPMLHVGFCYTKCFSLE